MRTRKADLMHDDPRQGRAARRRHAGAGGHRLQGRLPTDERRRVAVAGGQERILRRRIKSVAVDEEDHARDGADRGVAHREGAGARAGRAALRRRASPRSCATCRPPAPVRTTRCSCRVPETRTVGDIVIAADRGLCGGYNSTVIRTAESDIRRQQDAGSRHGARHRRPQARGLLPVPRLPDRRASFGGFSDRPHVRGRARGRRRP